MAQIILDFIFIFINCVWIYCIFCLRLTNNHPHYMVIVHRQFIKKVLNLVKTGKINKTAGFLVFSLENPN